MAGISIWQGLIIIIFFGLPFLIGYLAVRFETSERRIGRMNFLSWLMAPLLLAVIAGAVGSIPGLSQQITGLLLAVMLYVYVYPLFQRFVRRARDAGQTRRIAYLSLIPLVNVVTTLMLLFKPSEPLAAMSRQPPQWHIHNQHGERGPFTAGEISALLGAGELTLEDRVWRDGWSDWVKLEDCRGLDRPHAADVAPRPRRRWSIATPAAAVLTCLLVASSAAWYFVAPLKDAAAPVDREFEAWLSSLGNRKDPFGPGAGESPTGSTTPVDAFEAELRRADLFAAISEKFPDRYPAIVEAARSDLAKLAPAVSQIYDIAVLTASDEALLDFIGIMKEQGSALESIDAGQCAAFFQADHRRFGKFDVPARLIEQEGRIGARLIRSIQSYGGEPIPADVVAPMIQQILESASQKRGLTVEQLKSGLEFRLSDAENCRASIAMFEEALLVNSMEGALVLRYLAQQRQAGSVQ